jgi:hypothetical protein
MTLVAVYVLAGQCCERWSGRRLQPLNAVEAAARRRAVFPMSADTRMPCFAGGDDAMQEVKTE